LVCPVVAWILDERLQGAIVLLAVLFQIIDLELAFVESFHPKGGSLEFRFRRLRRFCLLDFYFQGLHWQRLEFDLRYSLRNLRFCRVLVSSHKIFGVELAIEIVPADRGRNNPHLFTRLLHLGLLIGLIFNLIVLCKASIKDVGEVLGLPLVLVVVGSHVLLRGRFLYNNWYTSHGVFCLNLLFFRGRYIRRFDPPLCIVSH
jgi:hypothetical protein